MLSPTTHVVTKESQATVGVTGGVTHGATFTSGTTTYKYKTEQYTTFKYKDSIYNYVHYTNSLEGILM